MLFVFIFGKLCRGRPLDGPVILGQNHIGVADQRIKKVPCRGRCGHRPLRTILKRVFDSLIGFADIIVGPRGRHESESATVLRGVVAPPPTERVFGVR